MRKSKSYYQAGTGKFTLVCDAGMGNWSVFFKPLAKLLEHKYRLCLIDRPGYTDGILPASKRLCRQMAAEIHTVITEMGIHDHIILVGHSLGGLNMRMYYELFPENVKGMILLDAAHPRLPELIPSLINNIDVQIQKVKKITCLASLGLLWLAKKRIPTFGLPDDLLKEYYKVTTTARYYRIYRMEMEMFNENFNQCKSIGDLSDLPLLVIGCRQGPSESFIRDTANSAETVWFQLQQDLATLSQKSTFEESSGDHFFHVTDQHFVASAIDRYFQRYHQ